MKEGFTVLLYLYNDEIKAIVQVVAKDKEEAEQRALRAVYAHAPYETTADVIYGGKVINYKPLSSYEIVIFKGLPELVDGNDYNFFPLGALERLSLITEDEPRQGG